MHLEGWLYWASSEGCFHYAALGVHQARQLLLSSIIGALSDDDIMNSTS